MQGDSKKHVQAFDEVSIGIPFEHECREDHTKAVPMSA